MIFASPKVLFKETDFTKRAADVTTTNLVIAGVMPKGTSEPRVFGSFNRFLAEYGVDSNSYMYYAAANILNWGSLICIRAVNEDPVSGAKCSGIGIGTDAGVSGEAPTIAIPGQFAPKDFAFNNHDYSDHALHIYANSTGIWAEERANNSYAIQVGIVNYADYGQIYNCPKSNNPPQKNGEFLIVVVNAATGTVLEDFRCSRDPNARDKLGSMYVDDRINESSQYIIAKNNPYEDLDLNPSTTKETHLPTSDFAPVYMTNGLDSTWATEDAKTDDILTAYWKCQNTTMYSFIGILGIGNTDTRFYSGEKSLFNLASAVRTRLYIDTPPTCNTNEQAVAYRNELAVCPCPDRVVLYHDWWWTADYITSKSMYLPPSIYVGCAIGYLAKNAEIFFAPAGDQYGKIYGGIKGKTDPDEAGRDYLYTNQVNPLSTIKGLGPRIWGDKTLQPFLSSLSFIGCRVALDMIEDAVERVAYSLLFRQNNAETRIMFEDAVNPYLKQMYNRGGLSTYIPVYVGEDIQDDPTILRAKLQVDLTESLQGIEIDVEIIQGQSVKISER